MELREFREAIGLTLQEVADAIDSNVASISRLERNLHETRHSLVQKVSEWAEEERKRRRLPASYRLTWEYLLEARDTQ